jgi:hypothetical protein
MTAQKNAPNGLQPAQGITASSELDTSKDSIHRAQRQYRVPQWWYCIREQAQAARYLYDRGILTLSDTALGALSLIDSGSLRWETIGTLFEAWNHRSDLHELAPEQELSESDRHTYARGYVVKQLELFGVILTALGVLREGGTA